MWPSPAQKKTAPSRMPSPAIVTDKRSPPLQAGSSKTSILDTSICRYKPNRSLPEKPYHGTDFHSMRKDRAKLPMERRRYGSHTYTETIRCSLSPGKRLTKIDSKPTGETHSTTQSTVATCCRAGRNRNIHLPCPLRKRNRYSHRRYGRQLQNNRRI